MTRMTATMSSVFLLNTILSNEFQISERVCPRMIEKALRTAVFETISFLEISGINTSSSALRDGYN